jgi:DNA-binding IscR family transcriptional regulator
MAEQKGPATSAALAKAMNTNPVVVRRVMSGLREQGYVRSEKGHGGGWTLSPGWQRITLREIYDALGEPSLLAIGNRTETPDCLVEKVVNTALESAFHDAEDLLLKRLGEVRLGALSSDFHARLKARTGAYDLEKAHGA